MDRDFGNWLAGFIDGEGCFQVSYARKYWSCRFTIQLRSDDAPILEMIQSETGLGKIYVYEPAAVWRVTKRSDCSALVELLDEHSLRAKQTEVFKLWAIAVRGWQRSKRGDEVWPQVAGECAAGIKALRRPMELQ